MRRLTIRLLSVAAAGLASVPWIWAGDGDNAASAARPPGLLPAQVGPPAPIGPPAALSRADEGSAMALVQAHLPELLPMLGTLKATNPSEYRKAITDLAAEARKHADLRGRNSARADLALEEWKARTRVELIAAQLAGSPNLEKISQLRQAIEARVDQAIRRQQFEVEQSESAVVRLREQLTRAESNRDKARVELQRVEANRNVRIENRLQSLLPQKKSAPPAAKPALPKPPPPAGASPMPATSSRSEPGQTLPPGRPGVAQGISLTFSGGIALAAVPPVVADTTMQSPVPSPHAGASR